MNITLDYYLIDKLVMWYGVSLSIYNKKKKKKDITFANILVCTIF